MSHEIRTPMNAILGMTTLLSESSLSFEQKDFVETISASGELLLAIINDILDFSKIEADLLKLETTVFDLIGLSKITARILDVKASEKGLQLDCQVSPNLHPFRLGDPTRLRQVLINLLGNAIKFTEHGGVILEVIHSDIPETIEFRVKDTGIGISEENQQSIFDGFSQADTSITRKFGGTGLGLAICKRLVELMGGRIWLESEPGSGTCFYFTIRSPESDIRPEPGLISDGWLEPDQEFVDTSLPPMHILMAEDIVSNQKVMKLYFKATPVALDVAENGKIAVEKFMSHAYDVVLMDIEMPEMDGFGAIRAIRQWEQEYNQSETPIIALTAHAFDDLKNRCFEVGCNEFLSKPLNKSDVFVVLRKLMNRKLKTTEFCTSDASGISETQYLPPHEEAGKLTVMVDSHMEELMPDLFKEIKEEMNETRVALENDDFSFIRRFGHGFKGASAIYKLKDLAVIFNGIEKAAINKDKQAINEALIRAADFIENVEIKYV